MEGERDAGKKKVRLEKLTWCWSTKSNKHADLQVPLICAHTFSEICGGKGMFAVRPSVHHSALSIFIYLFILHKLFVALAASVQFSNHPKEDSVEHVLISREEDAGRE